jgi:hypothetical protein
MYLISQISSKQTSRKRLLMHTPLRCESPVRRNSRGDDWQADHGRRWADWGYPGMSSRGRLFEYFRFNDSTVSDTRPATTEGTAKW